MSSFAPVRGFWSRRGIRARATIVAVGVVAIALLVIGSTLVFVLRGALTSALDEGVQQRAREVAAEIADENVEAATPSIDAAPGDNTLVQIVDSKGKVLVSSPSIIGKPAIQTGLTPGPTPTTAEVQLPFVNHDPYIAAVMTAPARDKNVTVISVQSLVPVQNVIEVVVLLLLLGAPFLLLAVGVITWFTVGRGMASVDRISTRVESIGGRDLDERVPVPEARDEIARLAVTMNHMLARLESSALTQQRFVADASHELRSPLASMRASLDVAQSAGGPEAWRDVEPVLSDEVDRMTRLVGDLLLLAKADEGALTLRLELVDLDDLASEEARRLRSQTGLTISTRLAPVQVLADRARLAQAVRNLVDNAVRFAQLELRISVRSDGQWAEIVVEDDGPGIPEESRKSVLDRFARQDGHRARDHGGTGLGLAITSEIVRLHSGELSISDSELGGAQLSISLPTETAAASIASALPSSTPIASSR